MALRGVGEKGMGGRRAPATTDRWKYNLDAAREFADGRLGALFYVIAGIAYYGGPSDNSIGDPITSPVVCVADGIARSPECEGDDVLVVGEYRSLGGVGM